MSKVKQKSPTYRFVAIMYHESMSATGHSWTRLNSALHSTLSNAINAGMRMDPDDFHDICNDMRGGYWFGTDNNESQGEGFYNVAVGANNLSACQSFEKWVGRNPFVWEGRRLCLGERFSWKGELVTVTRMPASAERPMIACSYKEVRVEQCQYEPTNKILHRHSISYDDLRTADRERAKTVKAAEKSRQGETCDECGKKYPQAGDGYDGKCPDCADKAAVAQA